MSRVALARIPSITFYKDSLTLSRRGGPIPQLSCIGKPCDLYTPDVVRCVNVGGQGTDVDWKCEADLPEALRFGRVGVSCEGWSGPGDEFVLKGSCGLQYRLVEIPRALRADSNDPRTPPFLTRWYRSALVDPVAVVFNAIWFAFLVLILYSFLKSCFGRHSTKGSPSPRPSRSSPGSSNWFPGSYGPSDPPPPYSKTNPSEGWRPGFWTGAALGGLGTYLFNSNRQQRSRAYDWERERLSRQTIYPPPFTSGRQNTFGSNSDDRGEGPSNLGSMRRSTGFGGSNVR